MLQFVLSKDMDEDKAIAAMKTLVEECDKESGLYSYNLSFFGSEIRGGSQKDKLKLQDSQLSARSALFFLYIIINPRMVEKSVCDAINMPCLGKIKVAANRKKSGILFCYVMN